MMNSGTKRKLLLASVSLAVFAAGGGVSLQKPYFGSYAYGQCSGHVPGGGGGIGSGTPAGRGKIASATSGSGYAPYDRRAAVARPYVTVLVGSPTGGRYDNYARTAGRFMSNYLPDNPPFIINNMPGGLGIRAANYLYNVAPRDGTTLMVMEPTVAIAPLFDGAASDARFEARKFTWIGSFGRDQGESVTSIQEARAIIKDAKTEFAQFVGRTADGQAIDPHSFTYRYAETENHTNYPSLPHIGLKTTAELPQIAAAPDSFNESGDQEVLKFLFGRQLLGQPFVGPPGMPADRVALLRTAFRKAADDPGVIKEFEDQQFALGPLYGEDVERIMNELYTMPTAVIQRAQALAKFGPSTFGGDVVKAQDTAGLSPSGG